MFLNRGVVGCCCEDVEGLKFGAKFSRFHHFLIDFLRSEAFDRPPRFLFALKPYRPPGAVPGDNIDTVLPLAGAPMAYERGISPFGRKRVGTELFELLPRP